LPELQNPAPVLAAPPSDKSLSHTLATHPLLATGFLAATATTFALGSTLIRFAYDAGAGTLAIVLVRTSFAALGLGLVLLASGIPIRLTRREAWAAPLIGVLLAGYSGAMYKGMEYMPVALTVLTFYTYPIFTFLFIWASGAERLTASRALAFPLAFSGLLLALDVSGADFSARGAAWALLGSLGFAAVLILSGRLFPKRHETRPRSFVMLATAAAATALAALASGQVFLPQTMPGWGGLMGSSLCYLIGMTSILLAASAVGAARVAVVMNVEPLASLVLTFLILGEQLRWLQLVGAALVIAAIYLCQPRAAARR
jgi:drug/metabolite transporter (DMT)-like permease